MLLSALSFLVVAQSSSEVPEGLINNPVLFIIIIGEILVLFIYITKLASKEIFSPSNKIHREVGRAKDLSAPLYYAIY